MSRLLRVLLLLAALAAPLARAEAGTAALAEAGPVAATLPAPVSMVAAVARLAGALVGVGGLLAACALGYRHLARWRGGATRVRGSARSGLGWFARWVPAPAGDDDRVEIASRAFLGGRESVCVVRVGADRFLVGVTAAGISLLGTLPAGAHLAHPTDARAAHAAAFPGAEPAPADFAAALTGALGSEDRLDERALRATLVRSRERLARLGGGRTP